MTQSVIRHYFFCEDRNLDEPARRHKSVADILLSRGGPRLDSMTVTKTGVQSLTEDTVVYPSLSELRAALPDRCVAAACVWCLCVAVCV
jgi:hypothetical protein